VRVVGSLDSAPREKMILGAPTDGAISKQEWGQYSHTRFAIYILHFFGPENFIDYRTEILVLHISCCAINAPMALASIRRSAECRRYFHQRSWNAISALIAIVITAFTNRS